MEQKLKFNLRIIVIALGISTATAASLSLLKVNKNLIIESTAVVSASLIIALKNEVNRNKSEKNYGYFFNRE